MHRPFSFQLTKIIKCVFLTVTFVSRGMVWFIIIIIITIIINIICFLSWKWLSTKTYAKFDKQKLSPIKNLQSTSSHAKHRYKLTIIPSASFLFSAVLTPNCSYAQEPIWSQCSVERENFKISTNSPHFHIHTYKYTFLMEQANSLYVQQNKTKIFSLIDNSPFSLIFLCFSDAPTRFFWLPGSAAKNKCEARMLTSCVHTEQILYMHQILPIICKFPLFIGSSLA